MQLRSSKGKYIKNYIVCIISNKGGDLWWISNKSHNKKLVSRLSVCIE